MAVPTEMPSGLFDDDEPTPLAPGVSGRLAALFEEDSEPEPEGAAEADQAPPVLFPAKSAPPPSVPPALPPLAPGLRRGMSLKALLGGSSSGGAASASPRREGAEGAQGKASPGRSRFNLFKEDSHETMEVGVSAALSTQVGGGVTASVPVREIAEHVWRTFRASPYFTKLMTNLEEFVEEEQAFARETPLPAANTPSSPLQAFLAPCQGSEAAAKRINSFLEDCVDACRECPVFTEPPPWWVRHGLDHGRSGGGRASSPTPSGGASASGASGPDHSVTSTGSGGGAFTAFGAVPTVGGSPPAPAHNTAAALPSGPAIIPARRGGPRASLPGVPHSRTASMPLSGRDAVYAPAPAPMMSPGTSLHTARKLSVRYPEVVPAHMRVPVSHPVSAEDDPLTQPMPAHTRSESMPMPNLHTRRGSVGSLPTTTMTGRVLPATSASALPGVRARTVTSATLALPGTAPTRAPPPRTRLRAGSEYRPPLEVVSHARNQLEGILMTHLHDVYMGTAPVDVAADAAFTTRLRALQWVTLSQLQLPEEARNDVVLSMARGELSKMDRVPTPEEKLECVLAAANVVFRALNIMVRTRDASSAASADDFLPVFIAVVLGADVPRLESNCRYVERFRSSRAMMAKAGYCFVNLRSAMMFLMNATAEDVGVSPEEWAARMGGADAGVDVV